MGHLTARCLLMLALGVCAAAQNCDNTGQNCDDITNISQCTADVYSQCCSRCSSLAGCFNIATNCFTLNYYQCHLEVTRQQCCGMCEHRKKEFLGADCLYGDKIAGCEVGACGNSNVSDAACCETCFKGTTPMAVSQVTMVNPTTPTACTDQLSSCADTVKNVPSTCYNGEIRGVCCKSCSDFQTSRQNEGYDVQMCPYGDKNAFCIAENFNRNNCSNPDNQFWCCDSCRPLTTTMATTTDPQCMDTSVSGCNLPASFCYNNFYSSGCCATCRGQLKHDLSFECRYGDKAQNCDSLINPDGVCDDAEKEQCCEACARREMTTTQDSCQDTIGTCSGLVNGVAANCYLLGDSCCATCRPFRKNHLAESCLYGDRNAALCSADSCGGNLQNVCCETCASTTMVPPTTTPMCTDNIGNCMDGPLQLKNNPKLCYSPGTYADCCGSCNMLKTGPAMCEWGSRESVCSSLQNIDCSNDNIKSICCEQCMASVTVTPMRTTTMMIMTTMAPPSNCTDKLGNCEGLTESISNCYPGKFVGDNCCASCFLKKKPNLPEYCAWGDTLSLCGTFITDDMLCEQDAVLKKDCCETCLSFQAATTPFQPTVCPNVWADSTCERVLGQLSGDCSSIQDKCCRTCLVTTTPAVTTPPPTTDSCIDTLDEATCVSIVTAEGAGECETDFMQERCCFTCRRLVPTTQPPTTPPACLGDALPNCADIQELLVAQDICDMLSFKNSCCAFCQTTQSPTMTPTTTVLPPGCDGDVWSSLLCAATITTSPLAAPCEESDLIKENCCATCALITTTAAPPTTTTMMTSTGPVCTGDNPAINCAAVAAILDVCASSDFSLQCCDFCRPTTVTTVATTTRSGLCSTNAVPDEECQALFEAGGGLRSCATSVLILSCCKFCSSITFPPTTTGTTTVPCIGDNPGVNCSSVDGLLNGNLCTPVSSDLLRQSCCDYCANLPTTATTPEPPTTVCVDLSSELECDVLAATGSCSNSLGVSQCCATCALFNAPSTTPTTTEIPTTAECIDTGAINCSGVALRGVNPCTSDAVIRQACCEFCINYTTPAPPITPPPCFGNSIDVVLCESRQDENPDFCSFDPVFLPVCCEFCGAPVLSSSPGTGGVTPATNAPVTTAAAESTTAAQCVDNIFPEDTCNNILQLDPNSCSGSSFFDQCCKVCISRSPARRRRSVEEIDAEVELSRERRQADVPCTTVNPAVCEVIISSVGMSPDEQCNNEFVKETCCEYCQRVRAALPEGKQRKDNSGGLLAKLFNF